MLKYLLVEPGGVTNLGGGSSTPASPRLYETLPTAARYRERYFESAAILQIDLDDPSRSTWLNL